MGNEMNSVELAAAGQVPSRTGRIPTLEAITPGLPVGCTELIPVVAVGRAVAHAYHFVKAAVEGPPLVHAAEGGLADSRRLERLPVASLIDLRGAAC